MGLAVAEILFQVLGERVFPLGVGAVFVRGCNPERSEFEKLVGLESLPGHSVAEQDGGEGFGVGLPGVGHGEFGSRVEIFLARWW